MSESPPRPAAGRPPGAPPAGGRSDRPSVRPAVLAVLAQAALDGQLAYLAAERARLAAQQAALDALAAAGGGRAGSNAAPAVEALARS